jgi:ubiquinone/menaquinone biosynthesis C-methylase UbiE
MRKRQFRKESFLKNVKVMTMSESLYIHGTAPEEQQRLSLLNALLNDAALQRFDLRGGEKILDVGSGLGQFTRSMARAAGPSGRVVGIERSLEQLMEARRLAAVDAEDHLADFRQGSATALPLRREEWGDFDIVHTRFLLEHVKDPLAVVRMMVEATRPGGRIILQDDDHDVMRIYPEPEGFSELWQAYIRSYEKAGNDPYVGRRLVSLLHESGANPTSNHWFFFGSCAGHPHFSSYAANLRGVLQSTKEAILQAELLSASRFDASIQSLRQWEFNPDGALWYAVCWAEGTKR